MLFRSFVPIGIILGGSRSTTKSIRNSERESFEGRVEKCSMVGHGAQPILTCPQPMEVIVTLAMLQVDSARTRLPLACSIISLLVLAVFGTLATISWLIETNNTTPDMKGVNSAHLPIAPATDVPDAESADPYATESWVRHGREF